MMKEHPTVYVLIAVEDNSILDIFYNREDAENVRLAMMQDDLEEYGFAFDYSIREYKVSR